MSTQGHEQRPYRPERLPQAAEQTLSEGSLRTALTIVRGVHEAVATSGYKETQTGDERWELCQIIRPQEALALKCWAHEFNFWLNEPEFTQSWLAFGQIEGGEHQVFQHGGYYYERNILLYHTNWLEYFHRLVLHN